MKSFIVLFLAIPLMAQIPRPQIPVSGNIGQGGPSFPLFNSGTITMTDANYTMTYPDMSARVIRVTSSVTLTTTRSVISPNVFGFEFIVENATTGTQSILFTGTSGSGVTIPNGQAVLVMYDGTNYVNVGSVSGGGGPLVSPVVIHSPGGVNTLTFTVPDSGDPSFVSSTGAVDIGHLLVSDLAGTGNALLQTDSLGNVSRSSGGTGGGVTSVGLASPNTAFNITGSPITTAGTINIDFVPQSTGFVLAGAQNATTLTPTIVQSNTCAVATGANMTCTFANPTVAGHLIAVGTPRNTTAVTDNLGQTYSVTPLSFVSTYYKESSAGGVTSITITTTNIGGAVVIWEISNIVPSSALDSDSYNVGNITGPNTPITWASITSSAQNDIFLGFWFCPNNSTTQPTAASPFALGGYQALTGNNWSVGWVWNVNTTISTDTPVVGTANCPAQQWSGAVAFRAGVSPLSAPPTFRPLLSSDLPRTPWSSLGNPTQNALTQLDMNTGLTLWFSNVNATGTQNDYGAGFGILDESTAPFSSYRDLMFLQGTQSNVRPLDVSSYCASGGTCAGFYVDGPTGNVVMYPNASVQIPGTGGLVSGADITSDTAMNAPVFNVCTAANPCIQPARAVAAKVSKMKMPTQSPTSPPPTKTTGGEPLSSFHLHDFSTTLPTDGQVPIFNASQGKYVPGTVSGAGGNVSFANITAGLNLGQALRIGAGSGLTPDLAAGSITANVLGAPTATGGVPTGGSYAMPQTFTPGYLQFTGSALVWGPGGTGGGGGPTFPVSSTNSSAAYTVTAEDLAACRTLSWTGAAAPTVTLPTPMPPNGQCVYIANLGGGVITVQRSGTDNINASAQSHIINPGNGNLYPNTEKFVSNGAGNWNAIKLSGAFSGLGGGVNTSGSNMIVGANTGLTYSGSGYINANRLLGTEVPPLIPGVLTSNGTTLSWGAGGGAVSWSSLTAPTQDLSVQLGNWRTVFQPNFSGDNTGGTAYAFQQTGTPGTGNNYVILSTTATASNVTPFSATNSQGNGLRIDGLSQGNAIRAMGVSKFLGPVQLTGLNSATFLGTDNTGNVIQGTGVPFPNITSGQSAAGTTMTVGGVGSMLMPANATGIVAANNLAAPTAGNVGNGLMVSLPVNWVNGYLHYTGNGLVWDTPPGGTPPPAYTHTFPNISLGTVAGPITLPGCGGPNCTAVTPTVDTGYRVFATVTQTAPGANCTANGSIQFMIGYTDADSGVAVPTTQLPTTFLGATTLVANMNMGNAVNSTQNMFNILPTLINAKAGIPVVFRIQQPVIGSGCNPQPTFTLHVEVQGGGLQQ